MIHIKPNGRGWWIVTINGVKHHWTGSFAEVEQRAQLRLQKENGS